MSRFQQISLSILFIARQTIFGILFLFALAALPAIALWALIAGGFV